MKDRSLTLPTARVSDRELRGAAAGPYASTAQSVTLVRSGAQLLRERIEAADMVTTHEAARLVGTSAVAIIAWIKAGRCIGVSNLRRGFKLPSWQFEPEIWPLLQPLAECLGTRDGWQLLSFLETPSMALNGTTPRLALEQGMPGSRILALAAADAH